MPRNITVWLISVLFLVIVSGSPLRADDEAWTAVSPIIGARSHHTASILPDGRVLVAGGSDGHTALATAELYEAAGNSWTPVQDPMGIARYNHTATVLADGRVLVAGGFGELGNPRSDVEIFDPRTDSWVLARPMEYPRAYHSATLLTDGRVLVTGGYTPNPDPYQVYTPTAEIFDPAGDNGNGTWELVAPMRIHRVAHVATRLPGNRVLVAGGANYAQYEATAEIYDASLNTWTGVPSMTTPRYAAAAVLLADGRFLIAGGFRFNNVQSSAEIYGYDPVTMTYRWTAVSPMSSPRFFFTATNLADGAVLVAGGWNGAQANDRSQVYDPSTSTWSAESRMSQVRYAHAAVLLQDGRLLVTGGSDGTNVTATAEIWGPPPSPDSSAPVIDATVSGTVGSNGWYQSDVVLSWQVSDLESPVTVTSGCGTSTVTSDTAGMTFTCTGTSGGGTASSSVTIKRDVTPPAVSISEPAAGALFGLGQLVNADYACIDATSGISTCIGSVAHGAALDTATPGNHGFTLTVIDAADNATNQTVSYTVLEAVTVAPAYAYVPNRVSQTVSVVDTVTNRTVATIPVGPNPINVAMSRDGARAYVANLNANYVSVIDTAANTNVGSLSVGNGPWGLAVSPDGARLFVANLFSRTVTAVDVGSGQTVASVNVAGNARGISLTADGRYLFVADATEGLIEAIDTTGMTIAALIPVGYQPQQAAITPDGTRVYVPTLNTIAVIDTGRVLDCLSPPAECSQAILTQLARTAAVPPSGQPVTIIPLPDVPSTIAFTADGARAYIAHSTPGGLMSVLETATHTLSGVVGLNNYPYGIGVSANGPRVYVGQGGGATLYVIDTTTITVVAEAGVGSQPGLMAITPIPATVTTPSAAGTYGGQVDLSATLMSDGTPVVGRTISFSLHGVSMGSATTGSDGVATLRNVSLGTLSAGSYPGHIGATFTGDGYYFPANATATLAVGPATPVITWPTPAEVIDGTVLSTVQLNASTTMAGTFTYTPAAGTVLQAGVQTLDTIFTPADSLNYTAASKSVSILVAPPMIVQITDPNGGEKVFLNTPYVITWTASGGVGGGPASFDLAFSVDGAATFFPIPGCITVPGTMRTCTWNAPNPSTSKGRIRVVARDAAGNVNTAVSSTDFKIVSDSPSVFINSPGFHVPWPIGSQQHIEWTHNLGQGALMKIQLSTDGGQSWSLVSASVASQGNGSAFYDLTVPNLPTLTAKIRVSWLNGAVSGTSNEFYIELPGVTVTAPTSGAVWNIDKTKQIKWSHSLPADTPQFLEITYDLGVTWQPVVDIFGKSVFLASGTKHTVDWKVTGPPTPFYVVIRVRVPDYGILKNSGNFTIK